MEYFFFLVKEYGILRIDKFPLIKAIWIMDFALVSTSPLWSTHQKKTSPLCDVSFRLFAKKKIGTYSANGSFWAIN